MHAQRSVRALFRTNLDLLTRKIAERTGKTGEHYITRDRAEYADMLKSAGRGGALTGITVFVKFGLGGRGFAPFVEGLVASLNYALSFCAIQFVHGMLATKQPAMTAATLAAKLKDARHRRRLRAFVDEVANLTRSQVAAIAGNLAVVVPAALLLEFAWALAGGAKIPDPEKAKGTIDSLNLLGATAIYAAFTGVLLWVSALLSGGIENWAVYRRLPEVLAHQPRLVHAFGAPAMQRAGSWFERNVAGWLSPPRITPVVAGILAAAGARSTSGTSRSVHGSACTLGVVARQLRVRRRRFLARLRGNRRHRRAQPRRVLRARPLGRDPRHGRPALSRRRVYRAVLARLFASPWDFLLPPRTRPTPQGSAVGP